MVSAVPRPPCLHERAAGTAGEKDEKLLSTIFLLDSQVNKSRYVKSVVRKYYM